VSIPKPTSFTGKGSIILGSHNEIGGRPSALTKIGDTWFMSHYVSKPQKSMIEALNTGKGGLALYDLDATLTDFGLTLADVATENLSETLKFLKSLFEYEMFLIQKNIFVSQQSVDELAKLRSKAVSANGPKALIDFLDTMTATFEQYEAVKR